MKKLIIISLFLATIFHQDYLWQALFSPQDRVMAPLQSSRTFLGDHYYYHIIAKKAVIKLKASISDTRSESLKKNDFFYENSGLENVYAGALLVSGLVDKLTQQIPIEWNFAMALSLILQLGLLFGGVLTAYQLLRYGHAKFSELVLFGFIWAIFCRGVVYGIYYGFPLAPFTMPAISHYPDILRIVNPQMSWSFGLFFLALAIRWLMNPSWVTYLAWILVALCLGPISMSVLLSLGCGLASYGLAELIRSRKLNMPLLGIGSAMLLSLLYTQQQFTSFYLTEKGMSVQTGQFTGLKSNVYCLLIIALLPLLRKQFHQEVRSLLSWIFISGLLVGSVAESFELGSRLWSRGAGAIIWFIMLYGIFGWLRTLLAVYSRRIYSQVRWGVVIALLLTACAAFALKINFTGWYNYIEKDKAEVISWLRRHASNGDVIVSADLEDAYYIPIYSNSQPYVQLRDYSAKSEEEVLKRYFRALDLVGLKSEYLKRIQSFTVQQHTDVLVQITKRPELRVDYESYQIHTFFGSVLYYPYIKSTKNIFNTDTNHELFLEKVKRLAGDSHASEIGNFKYLIIKKDVGMKTSMDYEVVFENHLYLIVKP